MNCFRLFAYPELAYNIVKAEAAQRTFADIIKEIISGVAQQLDIIGGHSVRLLNDCSKSVNYVSANFCTVFNDMTVAELLFLGDEEDDVWTQDTVVEALLKFLNMHIIQDGFDFYMFSWSTVRTTDDITWYNLLTSTQAMKTTRRQLREINTDIVADCDTTIDVGEVYNQLLLTCKTNVRSELIEPPLDSDALTSVFGGWQKYCTEYYTDANKWLSGYITAKQWQIILNISERNYDDITDEDKLGMIGTSSDWYVEVKKHASWRFPMRSGDADLIDYFGGGGMDQQALPNWMGSHLCAAIMSLGRIKKSGSDMMKDNSFPGKVSMSDYLVMSINGNGSDSEETTYPKAEDIRKAIPYAEFTGNTAGGTFSPVDDTETNYIVLSGSLRLNPRDPAGYPGRPTYKEWVDGFSFTLGDINNLVVPSKDGNRLYTRKLWRADHYNDTPVWDEYTSAWPGLFPPSDDVPQDYEFKYSAVGDSDDHISKVSLIACMLVIGDKCVVETGTAGKVSDFTWKIFKPLDRCKDEDEYYSQCFYIGIDPKIGDKLTGTDFDFQNNISVDMRLDTEGIAIPIRKADRVSGQVKFTILGPVNVLWDTITRRHPTFFRHTKWTTTTIPLLAHVSALYLKDFECKFVAGGEADSSSSQDNDVVYMSDTDEAYVNRKDDIEFTISSALTAAERKLMGVKRGTSLSTPLLTSTGDGVRTIYDTRRSLAAKPEQLYVDAYYSEYHTPHVLMQQSTTDTSGQSLWLDHFRHLAINKEFYIQDTSRNLMEGTAKLTLKEI